MSFVPSVTRVAAKPTVLLSSTARIVCSSRCRVRAKYGLTSANSDRLPGMYSNTVTIRL